MSVSDHILTKLKFKHATANAPKFVVYNGSNMYAMSVAERMSTRRKIIQGVKNACLSESCKVVHINLDANERSGQWSLVGSDTDFNLTAANANRVLEYPVTVENDPNYKVKHGECHIVIDLAKVPDDVSNGLCISNPVSVAQQIRDETDEDPHPIFIQSDHQFTNKEILARAAEEATQMLRLGATHIDLLIGDLYCSDGDEYSYDEFWPLAEHFRTNLHADAIVVHCSAGTGRSSTAALLFWLVCNVQTLPDLTVPELIEGAMAWVIDLYKKDIDETVWLLQEGCKGKRVSTMLVDCAKGAQLDKLFTVHLKNAWREPHGMHRDKRVRIASSFLDRCINYEVCIE